MFANSRHWLKLSLLFLFLAARLLCADGFIIIEDPHPSPEPAINRHFPLSVKYHKVECVIKGQLATTQVDQVFKRMQTNYLGIAPVVKSPGSLKIVGLLTYRNIFDAYEKALLD